MRVEVFRQGIQAVRFAGNRAGDGDGEAGKENGQPHGIAAGVEAGIQREKTRRHDDAAGQHDVARAFAVEHPAKQRRANSFDDTRWQKNQPRDRTGKQQHLLHIHGQQQFQTKKKEKSQGENNHRIAVLRIHEGAHIQQGFLQR